MKKIPLVLTSLIASAVMLSSCSKSDENKIIDPYSNTQPYSVTDPQNTQSDTSGDIFVDESWKSDYVLKYTFFDKRNESSSEITECVTPDCYISLDSESGIVTYVIPSSGYLLRYILNPAEKEGTVSVITGSSVADLQSGFYLMSVTDRRLPSYSNVTKTGTAAVAGREADEYIQTGYADDSGETMTAKIYIDKQYGFASKCELYNSSRELQMSWELEYINTDPTAVASSVPQIDLSEYEITSSEN